MVDQQSRLVTSSHTAYSDESYYTDERFRSIAVVTFESNLKAFLSKSLRYILDDSGVGEFKWNKLRQARDRFAAVKMIDETIKMATAHKLRIDALIWDTEDSRHHIRGRDDSANLQRMYHHLFKNVLLNRWPAQSSWNLYPDQNSALDWLTAQDYLDTAGVSINFQKDLFGNNTFSIRMSVEFQIQCIEEVSSTSEPICQLADLFAGIGAYSHSAFLKYKSWHKSEGGQLLLGLDGNKVEHLSNSERERFKILNYLDCQCKNRKLGVSMNSAKGFKTYNPRLPINFWLYEPQHADDKAPTKSQ